MHWYKPNKKKRKLNPMVDHSYLLLKNNLINFNSKQLISNKRLALALVVSNYKANLSSYSF